MLANALRPIDHGDFVEAALGCAIRGWLLHLDLPTCHFYVCLLLV